MDQSEKKLPIDMQAHVVKPAGGKSVAFLAGAVSLLAVSFVVVVAVTAWSLNKDNTCQTASSTAPTEKETYQKDITVGEDVLHETIVTVPGTKKEYIVARNKTNGLVSSVTTVDYEKNQTTSYSSLGNMCLVAMGHLGDFEETEQGFKSQKDYPSIEISFSIDGLAGDRVTVPVEMTPYCTMGNTYLLVEKSDGDRAKRHDDCPGVSSSCPQSCFLIIGPVGVYQGSFVFIHVCWVSQYWWCEICPYNPTLSFGLDLLG